MKNYILPPLVLTIICVVVSGLVALAYNKTYVDTTGVMTDELKEGCAAIFGEGDYQILLDSNAEEKTPVTFGEDGVISIITDGESKCLIELEEDGYAKGGLHLLIGINPEGAIEDIYFLEIGETPGIGTRVQEDSFLEQFKGFDANSNVDSIDNVTSATFSSRGMKSACKKAVSLYSKHKEEIFVG